MNMSVVNVERYQKLWWELVVKVTLCNANTAVALH